MLDPLLLHYMHEALQKEAFLGGLARGALTAASQKLTQSGAGAALQSAGRAVGGQMVRSAGNVGAGMGLGAAAGGALGAAHGAYQGYSKPVEEGGGTLGALSGALAGGSRGALIGTAVGGAAGLASGGRGAGTVAQLTAGKYNPLGLAARSGQRQLHSVTGLVPGGAARGTPQYAQALTQLNVGGLKDHLNAAEKALQRGNIPAMDQVNGRYRQALEGAQKGQTSLAGIAQNFQEKGLREGGKDVLQHGLGNAWRGQSTLGKAALIGTPAAGAALAAAQPRDPNDPDAPSTKGEQVGGALGSGVASALTPFVGSTGGRAIGHVGSAVGGTIGKGIGQLVGVKKNQPPSMTLGGGAATPGAQPGLDSPQVERVMTNAAQGKPPDNLMS